MSDQWTDRLSGYLDGDLKGSERALLEAHLERCEDCQDTLASLRRVVRPGPARWRTGRRRPTCGPASRRGSAPRRGRWSSRCAGDSPSRFPSSLAAGVALAVLSASGAWMLHPVVPTVTLVQPAPPGRER